MKLISSAGVSQRRHVAQLIDCLGGEEFTFQLVVLGREATPPVLSNNASTSLTRLPLSDGFDPRTWRNLRREIAAFAPDIVHAVDHRSARYAAAALLGVRAPRFIVGPLLQVEDVPVGRRWLDAFVRRRAHRVVTTSTVPDRQGEQTVVIPYGVDNSTVDFAVRRALLAELELPEESRLIGVAAPLEPRQRIKDAIWAADLLKCVRDDTHLLILGEGPHRWRLERYCRQVQITDRVHFLGERSNQGAILATLDCYWATAVAPQLPWPMLEAMAAGVPVIAVDAAVTRELFADVEGAPLVGAGDRASRARHTNALLDDASLSRARGEAGKQAAIQRCSRQQMEEAYRALYRELANRNV